MQFTGTSRTGRAAIRSIKATKPCKISTVKVLEIRGSCVGMKDTYSADVTTYSCKISTVKVLKIRGSCVGMKDTYSADFTTYSILKKGQNWHPPFCQPSHM